MPSDTMPTDAESPEALAEHWNSAGYIVVRGIYDRKRTERLRALVEDVLARWRRRDPQTGAVAGLEATCMRHLNHPDYFPERGAGFRELMEAVADERVLATAQTILGEEALFRCTSLFFNPVGASRDGNWHRDTQFGASDDEAERATIEQASVRCPAVQLQIALVASDDIEYVPGSHRRWDTAAEYAIRKADAGQHCHANAMPGALRIALEPGDAVLFNPFGHHRGRYHADRPRRTFMLTYTSRSRPTRDYFTDQPWFLEPGYLDGLAPRTRGFFDEFVAVFAEQWRKPAP